MSEFQTILDRIALEARKAADKGVVASYIPQLACIDASKFGMALLDGSGELHTAGDAQEAFSIQSISKVLTLALAFQRLGDSVWERVGFEPSGDPFNHLSLLEQENGIPRNPLINAGAITIADILVSEFQDPKAEFLDFVRKLANDPTIDYDPEVARSEKATGFRNFAAANLIKSFGNLKNDVDEVLDFYFHQCALHMSCEQLVNTFYVFANRGKCLQQLPYLSLSQVKRINAIMLSCGFYDEAGEFAFRVGLPGKSGVGGGIVAIYPERFSVATWSPGLNAKGNSKLGMFALEKLTTDSGLSIF
ncbi:glutaminase [Flagellimonas sp. DF-77]|uniref:glutaminase n=1 Tax=Flagellimonas algarum TaxID=3230298 RepID=UPI003398E075